MFHSEFNIRVVDEDKITKTIGSQAGYLAALQGRLLHPAVFTALNHFLVLIMHFLRQTQAGSSMSKLSRRHMIMFEMHFQKFCRLSQTNQNRFVAREVSLICTDESWEVCSITDRSRGIGSRSAPSSGSRPGGLDSLEDDAVGCFFSIIFE